VDACGPSTTIRYYSRIRLSKVSPDYAYHADFFIMYTNLALNS